jgi:hypothetical protein
MKSFLMFLIGGMFFTAVALCSVYLVWWKGLLCESGLVIYSILVNEASTRRF